MMMMTGTFRALLVLGSLLLSAECLRVKTPTSSRAAWTRHYAMDERSPEGQARLKAEIASPFRLLRFFVYGGTGAAGALGAFTAVPQLLFALQDADPASLSTAGTNLAIDLGALIGAVVLFDKEKKIEDEKLSRFTERERRSQGKMSDEASKEREVELAQLPVEIIFSSSNENTTRIVSIADLQNKGSQNVIVVAGSLSFVKDAVLGARAEGSELFNQNNVYVVPVVIDDEQVEESELNAKKGFGAASSSAGAESILSAPFIGKPAQVPVWQRFLAKEVKAAEAQGTKGIVKQGLVLAVDKGGRIVRRGLGRPPWKNLIEDTLVKK